MYTLFFLAVFPLLAYPLQRFLPKFRENGREGQRHLAMLFAFVGYLLECIMNTVYQAPAQMVFIGWVYLVSGVIVLLANRLLKLRPAATQPVQPQPAVFRWLLGFIGWQFRGLLCWH